MYHPGENGYQRNSRFDQWQHTNRQNWRQNNGNHVRDNGPNGTHYSTPWRGSQNSIRGGRWSQKQDRSRSCSGQRNFQPDSNRRGRWSQKQDSTRSCSAERNFQPDSNRNGCWSQKQDSSRSCSAERNFQPNSNRRGRWSQKQDRSRSFSAQRDFQPNSNRSGRLSQKEQRGSSRGCPSMNFQNQSWEDHRNVTEDFQLNAGPSQNFRQPRNFVTESYKNTGYLQRTSDDRNESKKYLGAEEDRHAFRQNPNCQVPKCHCLAAGESGRTIENQPHRKEDNAKLYVIDEKVVAFIRAYIPADRQPHAMSAFEKINARVITNIITYHCHYCCVRCRTQQDLEDHKKTAMHIKKRNKFVKNWSKTK